jgi:hypothetical protein
VCSLRTKEENYQHSFVLAIFSPAFVQAGLFFE